MILIKTKLKESAVHGIGLFADEPIKKGAVIWRFNKSIDRMIKAEQVKGFTEMEQKFLGHYASKNGEYYFLSVDNFRFMNHSDKPNVTGSIMNGMRAFRDIAKGEELTCNYQLNPENFIQKGKKKTLKVENG